MEYTTDLKLEVLIVFDVTLLFNLGHLSIVNLLVFTKKCQKKKKFKEKTHFFTAKTFFGKGARLYVEEIVER